MTDQETGSSIGRFFARWWWLFLLVYLAISIFYQAFIFPSLPGETRRYHFETDCYVLEIRFPLALTVASQPGGEVSQPASFWLWRNSTWDEAKCKSSVLVAISPAEPIDLVWLQDLKEGPPAWQLDVTPDRERTKPQQTFVYLAPQEDIPSHANLNVTVEGNIAGRISVSLWSAAASGWFRLTNLLFGSQNLALVTGIITILGGIYKLFHDEQERRKQQQKEFDTALAEFEQKATEKPEQIANEYLDLLSKIKTWGFSQAQQERLRRKFQDFTRQFPQGHIWARALRARLAQELNVFGAETFKASTQRQPTWMKLVKTKRKQKTQSWPEVAQSETQFLSPEQFESLKRLLQRDGSPSQDDGSPFQDLSSLLRDALQVFRALGVESRPFIVRQIEQAIEKETREARRKTQAERLTPTAPRFPPEISDALKTEWFENGKAAGHYLLEELVKKEKELHKALLEWEENDPAPPNGILPPFGLWGNDPVYETPTDVLKLFNDSHPRWRHPFGPRKAEDDPRLPLKAGRNDLRPVGGLFWDEHPLWQTILSLEPCFITVSRGNGASAFQRMGRHIRRFWGRKPSLSLGLSLNGKADSATLWHNVERALSEALRRDLVEDPYWLLGANAFVQEWVVSFFEHVYGNIWRLSSRLQEAGLPEEETDLVIAALHAAAGRNVYQGAAQFPELLSILRQRLGEAARYRLRDDRFEVLFWVELKDADFTPIWLDLMAECGLLQLGVAKIFSPEKTLSPKLRGAFQAEELTWTEKQLTAMLQHRFKQTEQSALLEEMGNKIPHLVREARGSPGRLIELGNRKLQELARSMW
ncbi:MAG: hypothetical protein RMJ85_01490 [Anaerolineales bacterium]|nr:hypothetical protein [Anaerolineales bacterium]